MQYTLTATRDGITLRHRMHAASDKDATMDAIFYILDAAYEDRDGPWAKGLIQLVNPDGVVIQDMPEKD